MGSPSANFMFSCQTPTWCYLGARDTTGTMRDAAFANCFNHQGVFKWSGCPPIARIMDVALYDMERLKICCEKIVAICETTPSLDIMCNPFCFVVFHQRHETKTLKANKFIVSETWAWRVSGGTWISPGLPYQILAGFNAWLDCDCEGVNPDTFERSIRTDGIWT